MLSRYPEAGSVALNWLSMFARGVLQKEQGLVVERFTLSNPECRLVHEGPVVNLKCVSRVSEVTRLETHFAYRNGEVIHPVCTRGERLPMTTIEGTRRKVLPRDFDNYDVAYCAHYETKSFEEYLIKRDRGTGRERVYSLDEYWINFVQNGIEETRLADKAPAIKKEMDRLAEEFDLAPILKSIEHWYLENTARLRKDPSVQECVVKWPFHCEHAAQKSFLEKDGGAG